VVAEAKSCQKNTNAQYCQRETRTERDGYQADTPLKSFELFFDIYNKFVVACEANYTPGTGCTVDESLHGFRGMCNFKQYIPNKPSK